MDLNAFQITFCCFSSDSTEFLQEGQVVQFFPKRGGGGW